MPTEARVLKLLSWLSPAFPVGAFGYSHGLETAIRHGMVTTATALQDWIGTLIELGSGWTDAVLFAVAWTAATREDEDALFEVSDLATALSPSAERRRETLAQGAAFLTAARAWGEPPLTEAGYPVAVGATAGAAGIPLQLALTAWLHAFAANLVSAAVRAVPLGQTDGVAVIAGLEPVILATAARAAIATLDDLGSASLMSDIASLRHETLEPRLFIS